VLRGPSISEVILSPEEIDFTGIDRPDIILALSQEGVDRRRHLFAHLDQDAIVIQVSGIDVPDSNATLYPMDFTAQKIKTGDWALATLSILAKLNKGIHPDMLKAALRIRFKEKILASAQELIDRVNII
jgi:2-oxoglutarate ferredoxin oxidoreductase subunit beta